MISPIKIPEYQTVYLPKHAISQDVGHWLWQTYKHQLHIKEPSFQTDDHWALTAQGWVGIIPLPDGGEIWLTPKVPIYNLLGMLAYAYRLDWQSGMVQVNTLPDMLAALADMLGQLVLARVQKGLHQAYVPQQKQLSFIRGRIQPTITLSPKIQCQYESFQADVPENQVIRYTLACLLRGGWVKREATAVWRAYRLLQPVISHRPFTAAECAFTYTPLNQDYQPIHALCQLFLSYLTPIHQQGESLMLPFLIEMSSLYEQFVAEWLRQNLPAGWRVQAQEHVQLANKNSPVSYFIDLVLYDPQNKAVAVLDTKYKAPKQAGNQDINQISMYGTIKDVPTAVLVYPTPLNFPLDTYTKSTHLKSLTFTLDDDLDQCGQAFLDSLTTIICECAE